MRLQVARANRPHADLPQRLWARVAAPGLDARLAAGEDPRDDPALACRAAQLVSQHGRRAVASGLSRVVSQRPEHLVLSASISCHFEAVSTARPVLEQLARALRSRGSVSPRGVALSQVLLTDPGSVLYRPAHVEELYEVAREALLALGPPEESVR